MKNGIRDALQTVQDQLNQDRKDDKLQGTILFAFSGHGGQINSSTWRRLTPSPAAAATGYLWMKLNRRSTARAPLAK